ncbi:MAG: DeoR/GlpR transcriptional regulator [Rhodobacteraceae bacterium]|uniref:DeoR/GlpR family DNA-binding transcription regulator n=1 Tax=Salipiger sp. HF18 TaxID=2721557 RepID=UPI00142DA992|nr:DeoR/GlpR family DNA-binding transcription regulator [Salipiger sp. HF18]NIY98294.1 DeoR/GlpR transcriptional regulator [Salipiger sp. HF18]NVK61092.1 DeoR/GlpR transcriptional regulator [Paracoccaceae bacterium]
MSTATSKGPGRLIGRVRKDRISQMVRDNGFMSSADLAETFKVSEMTVRRDLAELEERGDLRRTHGGAIASEPEAETRIAEPFFDERLRRNAEAKARIARAAARLVTAGQITALDVGTTTFELGKLLVAEAQQRVFTNNLRVAALDTRAEVYLLGGRLRPNEKSMVGPIALEQARKLWFDIAFIGVSSISPEGIFDYSIEDTEIKRVYMSRATRKVVLADSSKFDEMALVQIGTLGQFDVLVTDEAPGPALAADLAAAKVKVIVAGA